VLGGLVASEFQTALVLVNAHSLPGGADSKGEFEGDGSVATADIEAAHSAADADSSKKRFSRRPLGTSQDLQTLRRCFPTQENVTVVTLWLIHLHSATRSAF
jgi:hypothetical protein